MRTLKRTLKRLVAPTAAAILLAVPALLQASPGPGASADLSKQVRHALVSLPYLNVFDNLSYRVDGSAVTLYGQVTRPYLKSDAERAVKHIAGVTSVNDQIEVLPLAPFDNQIRLRTYRAIFGDPSLQRYGMGTLPSIRIIVKNGNVTLEGIVSNNMDRQLAYMRANGVPGVFSVTNDLEVAPRL